MFVITFTNVKAGQKQTDKKKTKKKTSNWGAVVGLLVFAAPADAVCVSHKQ